MRALTATALILGFSYPSFVTGDEGVELGALLTRASRLASVYRDGALRFSCRETIRWMGHGDRGTRAFNYIYTFAQDGGFEDYRTRIDSVEEVPPSALDPLELGVPTYLADPYLWIFVFRESRQPYHHYTIVGEETALGRSALAVEFEPIPPYRDKVNDWFGTAWIDVETSQLLRVEAYTPQDHETKTLIKRHLGSAGAKPRFYPLQTVVTEFGFEKNGLRFPSKVEMRLSSIHVTGRPKAKELAGLVVTQTYSDYRFYRVRTESEVRGIVAGSTPLW